MCRVHVQVDFNNFFIIFAAIQIVLSAVPKVSRVVMVLILGVTAVGYFVGLVGLLCRLLTGKLHESCTSDHHADFCLTELNKRWSHGML